MYKITIQRIETVERTKKEYEKIADTGNEEDDGSVYGYVDKKIEEEEITTLLEQQIQNVNDEHLTEIIKAINEIK